MSIYSELQGVASDLFAEFKQGKVEHVRTVTGAGPADEPGATVETVVEIDATVKNVSMSKSSRYLIRDGLAVAGDLLVSTGVPANPFTIQDFIQIDDIRYKIVSIAPKPAAGTPVAFSLIVRR